MNNVRILACEYERKVKCFHRLFEFHLSAQGNALGDVAYQGWLDADGLGQVSIW